MKKILKNIHRNYFSKLLSRRICSRRGKIIFLSLVILLFTFYFLFSDILPVFAQIMKFQVPIPGMNEEIEIGEKTIGSYVSAFYRWSVTAVAILAVVMIMISGLQWIFAAGNPPAIAKAKEQMMSSIIGLVLVLLAIPILKLINPALVKLNILKIPTIAPIPLENLDIRKLNLCYVPKTSKFCLAYSGDEIYQEDFEGAVVVHIVVPPERRGEINLHNEAKKIKDNIVLIIKKPDGKTENVSGAFKDTNAREHDVVLSTETNFVKPKDEKNYFHQPGKYSVNVDLQGLKYEGELKFEVKPGKAPTPCGGVRPNECMSQQPGLYCHPQEPAFITVIDRCYWRDKDMTCETRDKKCSLSPTLDCNKCPLSPGEKYCVFRWKSCEGPSADASAACIKKDECITLDQINSLPVDVRDILRGRYCKREGMPGTLALGCARSIKGCPCGNGWVCCKKDIHGNSVPCACIPEWECEEQCD